MKKGPASVKERCLEVMDLLEKRHISRMFAQPVDPVRDNCPDYIEVVTKPIDLGTIRKNLNKNYYQTVEQWKADMELVWENSLKYNKKTSLLGMITKDLADHYHHIAKNFTDSPQKDWINGLKDIQNEFGIVMRQNGKPQKRKQFRDQLTPTIQLPPPETRRHFQSFSQKEIDSLKNDLSMLTEDSQLHVILEILKKYEDTINDADDLEIDINSLQPTTLHMLRERVTEFLHTSM